MTSEKNSAVRFSPVQRVEHFIVMVVFTLLAITGFPQKWPDYGLSRAIVTACGGINGLHVVHRVAGILFSVMTVLHLAKAGLLVFFRKIPANS